MTIKVYLTNIAGNQLTISNQRKVIHILDANKIDYAAIDISDPINVHEKEFLQRTLTSTKNRALVLPQIFNDEQYCCDYDGLLTAVESNTLKEVLKLDN